MIAVDQMLFTIVTCQSISSISKLKVLLRYSVGMLNVGMLARYPLNSVLIADVFE